MKKLTFITIILVFFSVVESIAGDPVGPAYAAQKAAELKALQQRNAANRPAPAPRPAAPPAAVEQPQLTGPAYSYARQKWLYGVQRQNARYWGSAPVGPAYANYNLRVKANQRLWNGTWPNNTYWFARPTVRIRGPYLSTPAFRGLSDPYIWNSQANSFWRY